MMLTLQVWIRNSEEFLLDQIYEDLAEIHGDQTLAHYAYDWYTGPSPLCPLQSIADKWTCGRVQRILKSISIVRSDSPQRWAVE